jgi:hypothetical protein
MNGSLKCEDEYKTTKKVMHSYLHCFFSCSNFIEKEVRFVKSIRLVSHLVGFNRNIYI